MIIVLFVFLYLFPMILSGFFCYRELREEYEADLLRVEQDISPWATWMDVVGAVIACICPAFNIILCADVFCDWLKTKPLVEIPK